MVDQAQEYSDALRVPLMTEADARWWRRATGACAVGLALLGSLAHTGDGGLLFTLIAVVGYSLVSGVLHVLPAIKIRRSN